MPDIGCGCYTHINQNIASGGGGSAIPFLNDRWDTDGMHTAAPTLTCQTAGYYVITGHIAWASTAGVGERHTSVFHAGANVVARQAQDSVVGVAHVPVGTIYKLAIGETLQLIAFQNTGAPLAVLGGADYSAEFAAQRIENTGCRAYRNADVSIPNGAWTTVGLNAERWDTDGMHDNAVNNSRITCQTAGYYAIAANAAFVPQTSGNRGIRVLLNGATPIAQERIDSNWTDNSMSILTAYEMGVGDYIEMQVWNGQGVLAQNLKYYGNYSPDLTMQLISLPCS